jgi:transcriptional regulator with XRE-family HTH domain
MDIQLGLKKILKKGVVTSELEFERASIIDRKLRLLVKEHPELTDDRNRLLEILSAYETEHWANHKITADQIDESDIAEQIAAYENKFYKQRKQLIKAKLKETGLTQRQLGMLLGHSSETYISELVSGINPFTLSDLILINKLFGIAMDQLIPTALNVQTIFKIRDVIVRLNNPKLKLEMKDLISSVGGHHNL